MRLHLSNLMLRLAATALLLALAGHASAGARGLPTLTPAQHDQLAKLFSNVEAKLAPALAADPKRRDTMERELRAIAEMKSGKERLEAGRQYRARHADYYAGALKKSGVDLSQFARELERLLPGHRFTVTRDHMVLGLPTAPDAPAKAPPAGPKVQVLDLADSFSGSCGGVSAGQVEHTDRGMSAHAHSRMVARCTQEGRYSAPLRAEGSTMAAVYRFRTDLVAEAIGVTGIGYAKATARVDGNSRLHEDSVYAVAPLLWYAPVSGGGEVSRSSLLPLRNQTLTIRAIAETMGLGLSGSNSTARISDIHAELHTTP